MKESIIPKQTKYDLAEIKDRFKDKCCFKINPIPTEEVFIRMGLDHSKLKDRMFLYNCVRRWNRETLKKLNFKILPDSPLKMKEAIYKDFLEKSWLKKEPFGFFNYKLFYTPLKYVQYEAILNRQAVRALFGLATSVNEMATKGMFLNGKIDANILLAGIKNDIEAIGISEKEMEDIKQLGLNMDHYFEDERICSKCSITTSKDICPVCGSPTI